ncbi:MAG: dTMP kinase [Candidatus Poseidoniales archaeon]|nr:MAG: dTMP kinase [Candidatus Poseidoniales archaeon]
MYLITIEGGDGSGKGLATKVISEVLEKEFSFSSVEVTGEPRREHPLGRLAIESVRKQTMTPEQEAGLFAADRVDHSHGWILPRLEEGRAVVSERNIHSSLVYQGVVGGLGVDRVAHMNSAALVPDLCIWVDCDPEVALRRIKGGTLRALTEKEEYFETSELQHLIREGYTRLLSGEIEMPTPFDMGAVIGPVLNEGTEREFRRELTRRVRKFIHSRPKPLNVGVEVVERHFLRRLMRTSEGQTTLSGIGVEPTSESSNWLDGSAPWRILRDAQSEHDAALEGVSEESRVDVPRSILSHSMSSICGTLSLLPSADISELRQALGPVRAVSKRHTQRIVKFLHERTDWVHKHRALVGGDAPRSHLKQRYRTLGLTMLAIWPLRDAIRRWSSDNPETHLRFAMGQVVRSGEHPSAVRDSLERIALLGSGTVDSPLPAGTSGLVSWWQGKYR